MLDRTRPRPHIRLLVASLLGAVGLALVIIGLGGPMGWRLIIPGMCMVIVSLPSIYALRRGEIEAAARANGRSRAVSLRDEIRR
jgi:hypothetical protein